MSETYLPELRAELVRVAARRSTPHRRRRRRYRSRALAGTGAATAVAATVAFMLGAGSDPRATAKDVRSAGVLLSDHFAVFGEPSDAEQPGNPFTAAKMGRFAIQPDSVHQLTPSDGLWVGADAQRICLSVAIEGENSERGSCARPAQVIESGLYTIGHEAPTGDRGVDARTTLAGLVPDGVTSLTFRLRDGTEIPVAAQRNGVFADLPDAPLRATFVDANGNRHVVPFR